MTGKSETPPRWVCEFGVGAEKQALPTGAELFGLKGASLLDMSALGLPVPPGFILTTEACLAWHDNGGTPPPGLREQVMRAWERLQQRLRQQGRPQLVSVRSGARESVPGIMDTILNLGLNDANVEDLARGSGERRFAFDAYRRFVEMYGDSVMGVERRHFEEKLEAYKERHELVADADLSADNWRAIAKAYQAVIRKHAGENFPQQREMQLWGAVEAAFRACASERARAWCRAQGIADCWAVAVSVQAMVFGNMGENSATGRLSSRDPTSGERHLCGQFLRDSQGDDIAASVRAPAPLGREADGALGRSLEETMPAAFAFLQDAATRLEHHWRDMVEVVFTLERGDVWLLEARPGRRSARAAVKVAVDMVDEGQSGEAEAVLKISPSSLQELLHPSLDAKAEYEVLARGLAASPGAASGAIVFHPDDAENLERQGHKVILVRRETGPEDIRGMQAAVGVITTRGGITSHAAVIARGMGRPCVCGARALRIDEKGEALYAANRRLERGALITIDGGSGQVILGEVARIQPEFSGALKRLMGWADKYRRMRVRANADTLTDAKTAMEFGAEGIGLCRTEHMFLDEERILAVWQMILTRSAQARQEVLAKLLPMQREDLAALFELMAGLPVTVRLLDPPLHEFLPRRQEDQQRMAEASGVNLDNVRRRIAELRESNPMLGHRGCRLGITYPEIYEMQARAIFEAAAQATRITGAAPEMEIMIPLVALKRELEILKERITAVAERVRGETGLPLSCKVGVMMELPRAALRASEIAVLADFFSFGTNDLTQTVFGISRDDALGFLGAYSREGILDQDPFVSIDQKGVGELIRLAVERGRAERGDIVLGICGEHGGDPASIAFCEELGLDYVSCSPYRAPIARLAAAQAMLRSSAAGRSDKPDP